jgi:polyhydroxyalkanoate synthesis regulator phasin
MKDEELISALQGLEQRARIAKRKIDFSSSVYRLQRRVEELEERIKTLENK